MKKISLFLLATVIITACSTKKLLTAGIASGKMPDISKSAITNSKFKVETIDTKKGFPATDQIIKNRSYVIPLPFCAFYKQHYTCSPGQKSFSAMAPDLSAIFSNELKEAGVKDNLSGNYSLKLKIEESNFKFEYNNKGSIIILIILEIRNKKEFIMPMTCSMKVSYELMKDNAVIKKGIVTKEEKITEKISADVPLPDGPTYTREYGWDPASGTFKNQEHYNTAKDYQQLQGGTYTEATHAMAYGYTLILNLMSTVSKDICAEIKDSVK